MNDCSCLNLVLYFWMNLMLTIFCVLEQLGYARRQLISNDAQRLPITR
jgi:hypothetical protein